MLEELIANGLRVLAAWWLVFVCLIFYTGWFRSTDGEIESRVQGTVLVPIPVDANRHSLTPVSAE